MHGTIFLQRLKETKVKPDRLHPRKVPERVRSGKRVRRARGERQALVENEERDKFWRRGG